MPGIDAFRNKMTITAFTETIRGEILQHLPEEYRGATATAHDVVKDNDVTQHGIVVRRPGEDIVPTIYVDGLYEKYRNGAIIYDLAEEAAKMRVRYNINLTGKASIDIGEWLKNYDSVKGSLFIRLCKTDWNSDRLKNAACREVGEFTETYSIKIPPVNGLEEGSVLVTQDMPGKLWGIDGDRLHADAIAAEDARGYKLCNMFDILTGDMDDPDRNLFSKDNPDRSGISFMPMPGPEMYVMSTADQVYGASVMVRDDLLQRASEIIGDNLVVLPSSVHEVIITGENTLSCTPQDLSDMVKEINGNEVEERDRLSDDAFRYDAEKHVLTNLRTGKEIGRDELERGITTDAPAKDGIEKEEKKPKKKRSR